MYRIVVRLEERNPTHAQQVYQAIQNTASNLAHFPMLDKPGRVKGTREAVVPGHPYILPYRSVETSNHIDILAVMHTAQEWPRSFRQKPQGRAEDLPEE